MKNRKQKSPEVNPTTNLLLNYVLIFMFSAFIGWIYEVIIILVQEGILVNRGVLHGPWLPIYGFGGLGIVILLERFRKHPTIVFLTAALGCGLMEYLTGWYLETFKHFRWWDYSDLPFNVNGRVSLMSVTIFGVSGLIMIYLIYPFLTKIFNHLPSRPKKILCFALVLFFLADFVYSTDVPNTGQGITTEISSEETNYSLIT